jgi:hypothetical protein
MAVQSFSHTGIRLPITTDFQQIAQRFAQQCPFAEKAQQIRQNTLAVCVVDAYLQMMEIPTQLAESDSWNAMMRMMADVADLKVPGVGSLSCRALLPQDNACYIPPEDWDNRAGYVAVRLDEAASQATLLGFSATIGEADLGEPVALDRFLPIETLIDQVHSLQPLAQTAAFATGARAAITRLGDWMEGAIATTWQSVESLVNPVDMSFAFRSSTELIGRRSVTDVSRAKLVDLGLQLGESVRVALVIHLTQTTDHRTDVILQLRPLGDSPYLSEGLGLTVLDENGDAFMNATSRAIDNYIQLRLSGQTGEAFGIRVSTAGHQAFEEQFII